MNFEHDNIQEKGDACLVEWENILNDETSEVLIADEMREAGAWDPSAFSELPDSWKVYDGQRKRNVNRLQDLSFGLESAEGCNNTSGIVQQQYSEGWPFESSPCRMFGGKNTKKNSQSAAEINERLFNPDFANAQQTYFEDFAETTVQLGFDVTYVQANGVGSFWGDDDTMSSLNTTAKRRSNDFRRDFKRRRSCGDIEETQQRGSDKTAAALLMKCNHSSDQMEFSSRRAPSGRATTLSKSDHPKAYRNTSSSNINNKSSSGASLMSCAHHRRRPSMERVMSVENMVPPEQFCHQQQTHLQNTSTAEAYVTADAATSINTRTIYRVDSASDHLHPRRRRRPARQVSDKLEEEETIETITSTVVHDNHQHHPQHTRNCSQKDRMSEALHSGDRSDASVADSKISAQLDAENDSEINRSGSKPGRDLRELLLTGEQADVTVDDMSFANRRLLHSVIYQHKLGLQSAALYTKIQREINEDPIKALQRPERPLFVEIPM